MYTAIPKVANSRLRLQITHWVIGNQINNKRLGAIITTDIERVLGEQGQLTQHLDGFAYRPQQVEMAQAVLQAIHQGEHFIAEAGTGTGKTFAYLVPALLSGLKVIVSTGTRNLQDQLFLRDLPRIRDAMASPAKIALLKGRANYLCIHRMDMALLDARGQRKEVLDDLLKVRDWSQFTQRGDIAELTVVAEDSTIWPLVTSNTDNCLGQDCSSWNECHLVEARRKAQEADVVVVNHHLLCADFAIKDEGFGELLPGADVFVIDEAHQLPEVASNFFGRTISTRQILELVNDTRAEYHNEAGDMPDVPVKLDKLAKVARDLRLAFGTNQRRGAWAELDKNTTIQQALDAVEEQILQLQALLEAVEGRGKGLKSCLERCQKMREMLSAIRKPEEEGKDIRWFETFGQSLRLNTTPLDIAEVFSVQLEQHPASWIFTSATLAVGDNFSHFQQQLGLLEVACQQWESPFDFAEQALWYVPQGMPAPQDPDYTLQVLREALPLIEANAGRAFLLFTSYRALNAAADWLEEKDLPYPLLIQGNAPKSELLKQFVAAGNALLLGTSSFWEGVDVRGDALSLVVIDKLPFASPGDPVLQARLDAIKARGGNPFMEYQVPQAAIALKQGAGRLIRDASDFGVFMLCDPRLLKKSYGHTFLAAMPSFARTREREVAEAFLAAH